MKGLQYINWSTSSECLVFGYSNSKETCSHQSHVLIVFTDPILYLPTCQSSFSVNIAVNEQWRASPFLTLAMTQLNTPCRFPGFGNAYLYSSIVLPSGISLILAFQECWGKSFKLTMRWLFWGSRQGQANWNSLHSWIERPRTIQYRTGPEMMSSYCDIQHARLISGQQHRLSY
jgi:hypothetical protein